MSDRMKPIPFPCLMDRALWEYRTQRSLFGVHALYRHTSGKTLPIFSEGIETPIGPAAGPHTQLAQNILASYAAGARFFELKTVQVIDGEDLPVAKPCILARDEGYNVEWSTELRVSQAYDEYVKAWFALKLLSREFGLGSPDGFVFNMSVGYDLAGIQTEKIDRFIEGLKDASSRPVWNECTAWAKANLDRFTRLDAAYVDTVTPWVCASVTLSTLHGCPPEEIERIAGYLITEKKLHTYVKCNPTLLGYEFARNTLDRMGCRELVFDDRHFRGDLHDEDAVPMFRRLMALAGGAGVTFGVKLTNTFPVAIAAGELPGEEMYLSGKSLYPLSIALAARLSETFGGRLRISYAGGADAFNLADIFGAGVWPVTMATTLLKPGGYDRLAQMAQTVSALPYAPFSGTDTGALARLAEQAPGDPHYRARPGLSPSRGSRRPIPLSDCFTAGCADACPIHQDIPAYLKLTGEGRYAEALAVICEKNPLPFITGTICPQRCRSGCVRGCYEEAVRIREAKLTAAQGGYAAFRAALKPGAPRPERVAVVGGGPAGMAAAFFLRRGGAAVTLFEKTGGLGGVVRHMIPGFRIGDDAIGRDAALLETLGADIRLNAPAPRTETLFALGYTHVLLACGAWKPGVLRLRTGKSMDALDFLQTAKAAPDTLSMGRHVAVVGGGNTAMDAARAAIRLPGVETVTLVYRRTARQMPADTEELELALADGVAFRELLSPVSLENGQLLCAVMALGAPDASGRCSPVDTGETVFLPADTVVSAVGEQVDSAFLKENGVPLDGAGRPSCLRVSCRLFVIGDARRGPATVVEAIADAAEAAGAILRTRPRDINLPTDPAVLRSRRGVLAHSRPGVCDDWRCLECGEICEICVDVCPNRANLAVRVPGLAQEQVVHLDDLCNECGNCAGFCPYGGAPYREKLTLFSGEAEFEASENPGFLPLRGQNFRFRLQDRVFTGRLDDPRVPDTLARTIRAVLSQWPGAAR